VILLTPVVFSLGLATYEIESVVKAELDKTLEATTKK